MKQEIFNPTLRRLIFVLALAGFFVVLYGADQGRRKMSNRVVDWLPAGFEETRDFNWFLKHFYEGELLMASWDGCAPDDPRLDEIARRLTAPDEAGRPPFYWKVLTTGSIFRELTAEPLRLTPDEARERMRGWILSKDDAQGCLVAFLSEEGYKDQHAAIANIRTVISEVTQLGDDVRIAGPSLDSVAIDDASNRSQKTLLPLFLAVCVLMLFILLKAWAAVFVVFAAAIFNEEMSAALIYYTGTNMDSISLLSASLVFVLTISGGLHLLNYYRDNMERNGKAGAALGAIKKAFLPCGLACLTTVLGLFSLSLSQVVPIRHFGIFASVALFLGTVFFFLFIGVFVEHYPIRAWLAPRPNGDETPSAEAVPQPRGVIEKIWGWLPPRVIRHRRLLTFLNLAILAFLAYNLPKLETTVTFHGMFRKDAPVIKAYDYLEDRIGGLVPVEVVVSIPTAVNEKATPLQSLDLVDRVEQALWEIDGVESSLSALTFVPYLPDADLSGLRAAGARSVFNKMVESRLPALKDGCLYDDRTLPEDKELGVPEARRWRISLRICAKSKIAYGPFLEKIEDNVERVIAENQGACGLTEVTALITGGVPVVHKAQKQLLDDLTGSYLSAFGLILLTLVFLLRGAAAGVLAMIPNIFPSVLVFGVMALLGQPVDMGTMMTASVALGISVDGTIHFLTWYRQGVASGKDRSEAVQFAYRECGTAMVQTTLICGGGMLVFAMSRFVPISRFAWMMALLLFIALYGDLVLFPALLSGKLGHFFDPPRRTLRRTSDAAAENDGTLLRIDETHPSERRAAAESPTERIDSPHAPRKPASKPAEKPSRAGGSRKRNSKKRR